ncbi:MAG: ester cyclase [Nitrososphaeraceae archaeon]|nr:ester cyclase [Nitrososphaeraceae archaeon]
MSFVENKQIAREFIDEVFQKGNIEAANKFVTPELIYHARGEDIEGIEEFKEWISSDRGVFPDLQFTFIDSIVEGGKVAVVWIVEGTHEKEFRGLPATHKKFETVGISVFHFEGNKIKEAWQVVDALTAAIQLGAVKTTIPETE